MLVEEKKIAQSLRDKGMSYSQIKAVVDVSKSTLSMWLRGKPLSRERIDELKNKNKQRIEKYRQTMRKKAADRLAETAEQARGILPISTRELYLAGLFLYWGEGKKGYRDALSISNTDPKLIKFAYLWMVSSLGVNKGKIRVSLHLYADMNKEKELEYWGKLLGLPRDQFYKPYIKQGKLSAVQHRGFRHGTCNISVCDVRLKERVLVSAETIIDSILGKRV